MQNAMPANAFSRSPWSLPGRLGAAFLLSHASVSFSQSCSGLIWSDVLYCCSSLLSSPPLSPFSSRPFSSNLTRTVHVWSVCFLCVCLHLEGGGSGAHVQLHTTARRDRGRTMLPSRGSDLAAPRGRSQPKSTFLHPETLISPSESPRKAQQHVLRYMHACTEPGALGPGQLARRRARPRTRSIQLFGASQQAWKQHHPHWGRELPALPDPPRICICHTFLGALRLPLCVSPGYLTAWVLRHCPSFLPVLSLLPWLQHRCLRTQVENRLRPRIWCGNGSERYSYVDSRLVSAS